MKGSTDRGFSSSDNHHRSHVHALFHLCSYMFCSLPWICDLLVECCYGLRDTSTLLHDQDPYVTLEYATTTVRTQVCRGKGRDPIFKQKFVLTLVDGHQEIGVLVWNKNTVVEDYLIGTARVPLETVLLCGSDDNLWALQFAGSYS
ncbi:elicitor-responsive protein 3-like isoform X2 [Nymphaea colorata]|uniref:elicitor-responsive protein 3-like isoform X2 n=1 Tax=Nymphaea colorata TaxID=210225 RepID=UPI00129D51C1|nr:elicitor-responsive protein 3-like isoform X2 [Nymphaea colorata]